jgi:hypothetical protein
MSKRSFDFKLDKAAKKKGGDKYVCMDQEDFVVYFPQEVSRRANGEPLKSLCVEVARVSEDEEESEDEKEEECVEELDVSWAEGKSDQELAELVEWQEWPTCQGGNMYGFKSTRHPVANGRDLPRTKRPKVVLQEVDPETGANTGMFFYRDLFNGKILYTNHFPVGRTFDVLEDVMRHQCNANEGFKLFRQMELVKRVGTNQEIEDFKSFIDSC